MHTPTMAQTAATQSILFTAGYGGCAPSLFVPKLLEAGVRTVVDVRVRPDRAVMGSYVRAGKPDKGIEALLATGGIGYVALPELGNPFLDPAFKQDWQPRYRALLQVAAPLLMVRLEPLLADESRAPLCLLCAEKDPCDCHRTDIAALLQARGYRVTHLVVPGHPPATARAPRKRAKG